jgi:hypothetical protein
MFVYLGESSSEFKSLVNKSFEGNEVQKFNISNENGDFSGFKVIKDEVEGYAYYHVPGALYQFASADVCSVEPLEMLKIVNKEIVPIQNLEEAVVAKRDEETKMVDEHKISFVDAGLLDKNVNAIKASFLDVDGFIFKETTLGSFSPSQDKTKNIFVPSHQVVDNGLVKSKLFITVKESEELKQEKIEKVYSDQMDTLKSHNIVLSDSKVGDYRLNRLLSKVKVLSVDDNLAGEFTITQMFKKIDKVELEQKTAKVEAELSGLGVSVKVIDDLKDDKISIVIMNKKGKELSRLTANDVLFTSEDVLIEGEDMSFEMVVFDLENEIQNPNRVLEIKENGKLVSLDSSKFEELYRVFDEDAHVVNKHPDLDDVESLKIVDDVEVTISTLDIADDLSFKTYVLNSINDDDSLKKELKSALGNKSAKKKI